MTLNQESLTAVLGGRPFKFYAEVESTQDIAFAWLKQGAPAGAVVIGDAQKAGRGRHGRGWHTPPGTALALSVILQPPARALGQVMMLGAVAVVEAAESFGAETVSLKWPNDVLLDGKKLAGVLPEASWQGDQLVGVVLGIGVNIRVDFTGTDVQDIAISLESVLNRPVNRLEFLNVLLERITFWQGNLGESTLFAAWESRLETLGKPVVVRNGEQSLEGVAEKVDSDGALWVRDSTGTFERVIVGELFTGS